MSSIIFSGSYYAVESKNYGERDEIGRHATSYTYRWYHLHYRNQQKVGVGKTGKLFEEKQRYEIVPTWQWKKMIAVDNCWYWG
jgi:hypothetical protein